MKSFHLASAQFLRLVKTTKTNSNIKIFGNFFKARDKIPPQMLKSFVLSMSKRVFQLNRENFGLFYKSTPCVLEKNKYIKCFPLNFIRWSYNFVRVKLRLFWLCSSKLN